MKHLKHINLIRFGNGLAVHTKALYTNKNRQILKKPCHKYTNRYLIIQFKNYPNIAQHTDTRIFKSFNPFLQITHTSYVWTWAYTCHLEQNKHIQNFQDTRTITNTFLSSQIYLHISRDSDSVRIYRLIHINMALPSPPKVLSST